MSVDRVEVGFVSGSRALVDFLAGVFCLEELPASEHGTGTLHRLQAPGAVIKVMVPKQLPADGDDRPFTAVKGLRYITIFVTDLDAVIERCINRGGVVLIGPFDLEPGSRLAIVQDSDGNTIEVVEKTSNSRTSRQPSI